jgi:DNA polymerase-3 subunit alpha
MTHLALTDQGNLYAAVEFYKACKGVSVTPIFGCELYVAPGSRAEKRKVAGHPHGYPIVLLAKNAQGYQNLCKLSSYAHLEGFYYTPRIDKELLRAYREGLICLSGPTKGRIAQLALQGTDEELRAEAAWYQELFGSDYYFEFLRHQMTDQEIDADGMRQESWLYQSYLDYVGAQERVIARLLPLAREMGIPYVAANDSRYLEREDWKAHEILMNIQSGEPCEIWEKDSFGHLKHRMPNPKRDALPSHVLHFRTPAEMERIFADLPEALSAACVIASCCSVDLDFKTKYYPVFVPPHLEGKTFSKEERAREAERYLAQLCEEGIAKRYTADALEKVRAKYPGRDPMQVVRERLAYELDIITSKGMCDYLLIVYDFINWAKRAKIPMGPGRGSGAGSIILYLIAITDIEPLRFHLFFERFINPERISYPDIDVDICMERRAEVIDYTVRKYGKEKVAQIITFGTMKAKMAIKDVGRVLSIPLARVNEISKLVPEDPAMTLDKALELDPEFRALYTSDAEVHRWIDIARTLEGSVRNTGIHAAGLIISADPIMERVPVCTAKDTDMLVTQFSMKPVESVGMLKIDFLGLKTLTSIQKAADSIKANTGREIDWVDLPLENAEAFAILNQGKTMGIFQVESGGMQDLAKQLHIDRFEEIIAVGALYRPGPMEMIPSFIQRKHGREKIEIDHPLMESVLAETYGIMVYQEQVMQIASLLAGYTLGEGDVLRRAMGKKDREEMARQREKFREGALKKGIDEETSMRIFDKVEKFASYGFNKSHAAAYGYLTYVTAYFKAHYPGEWMAALMTSDREDIAKLAKSISECQSLGIAILPPDINESGKEFTATPKGIRFAISGIKGVGEGVVDAILEERQRGGAFKSLYDFFKRVDARRAGKKMVELLIEAGAFDFTGWSRQEMRESVEPMHAAASQEQKDAARGYISLFSLIENDSAHRFSSPPALQEHCSRQYQLRREKELLGFYLTGHPMEEYRDRLSALSLVPLNKLEDVADGGVCRCAFIVEAAEVRLSAKTQRKFAILMISDGAERFELPIWPDLYEEKGGLVREGQLLYAVLQVERKEEALKLQCRWMDDLTQVNDAMIRACDDAFDRSRRHSRTPVRPSSEKEKKPEPPRRIVTIKVDADRMRHSHVMELKQWFRAHSGMSPVSIEFHTKAERVGVLEIASEWGVEWSSSLEQQLRSTQWVASFSIEGRMSR